MTSLLRFDPTGKVACLYTEAIDLRALGKLEVTRATEIRFNPDSQEWEVRAVDDDHTDDESSRIRWDCYPESTAFVQIGLLHWLDAISKKP
jgi:hypothetical protein